VQFPITIGLHRSHFLDGFVALCTLLASGAILGFPQTASIRITILLFIGMLAIVAWHRLAQRLSAIRLEASGQVSLARQHDREFLLAELLPGATVHPWLTVVRLKADDGQLYTLLAAADSMNREDFRRLRVFLRWRADFSAPKGDA
jgi:toxin CptA